MKSKSYSVKFLFPGNVFSLLWIIGLSFYLAPHKAIAQQLKFQSLDSLYAYADKNSVALKLNNEKLRLAKWQKIAASYNLLAFKSPVVAGLNNNNKLPVTFLPAEAFGGPAGTFKEVTMGQQYVTNVNIIPQIEIINPSSIARLKEAGISKELTEVNNLITKQSVFENLAIVWYTIVSLQEQSALAKESYLAADSILRAVSNKYEQEIVRLQDLNDATINKLYLEDQVKQFDLSLQQQLNNLKVLCDAPENTELIIEEKINYEAGFPVTMDVASDLILKSYSLQSGVAKAQYSQNRLSLLPSVSLFNSFLWQQNSNNQFFDSRAEWIPSQYLGLRLNFNLDFNQSMRTSVAKINFNSAVLNLEHARLQNAVNNRQLKLDYEKAYSELITARQVYELKSENYRLSVNQYNEEIIALDKMLQAFNSVTASKMAYSNAMAKMHYTQSKINLMNSIK